MRVNVYAEEITDETEMVSKTVTDENGTRTFYGVRTFLKSPPELHTNGEDDDRAAVTFWIPWTQEGGHDWTCVSAMLVGLSARVMDARDDYLEGAGYQ